ncbi:hypothetical protein [Gloeothece verrucosa]|uniref:WD40 repeat, subgroup n=1 Tax=Gloeothece verrucosa (strain PCC 7822) TaxID=497965 RepID=E0UJ20_GLOV7|nr:hypothetical protein [Gloeothece verrucosa]ADN14600.1 WD40 repeat, subgroup [Gloeothece verrucosa PCC 7822]
MSDNKGFKYNQTNTSYYSEIGGDFKGIQGDITARNITQYIITQQSGIEITQRKLIEASPYVGLEKFKVEDKDKFFGRDSWIRDLTAHLKQNKVLLLLGASGSGKSSLIQAGLIPALRNETIFISLNIFCFVPDKNPFESFYGSLLTKYRQSEAKAAKIVKQDTLIQVVKSLKNDSQWLIFIDQFEELFTLTPKTEQSIFINSLTQLIDKLDESVRVVMTMRADFLDKLSPYPDLGKIHNRYSRMLTNMDDSELRLAIAEPAARNGVIFEKGLIETIIADFHEQAGSLPLLQYTLDLLWKKDDLQDRVLKTKTHLQDMLDLLWKKDNVQDRVLKTKTYQDLGGVRGALQKQANTIYGKFDARQRKLAKEIFLELISLEGGKNVSRRADKAIFEQDEIEKEVLYQLIDNRLLVSRGDDGKATVEVAHEELIRSWEVLQELIRENEQIIILRNRLYADAKEWDELRKQDAVKARGDLWSGSKLARIVELRREHSLPNLDDLANEFIDASVKEREEQQQRELKAAQELAKANKKALQESQKREEEQRKANKRLRQVSVILGVLLIAVGGFGWAAWNQKNQAEYNQAESLGRYASSLFDEHKELEASVTAIKAGKILQNQHTTNPEVTNALHKVLFANEYNRLERHNDSVTSVSFSPDGKILASGSWDKTIKLWDVQTGQEIRTLSGHNDSVYSVSFSGDGKILASGSRDKTIKLWDVQTGKEISTLSGHNDSVYSVSFSPDGKILASGSGDKTIKLWDVQTGQEIRTLSGHNDSVYSVSFSPDGKILASGSGYKTIKLWDVQTGQEIRTLSGHNDSVLSVSFSGDGKILASGSRDKTIKLWDVQTGQEIRTLSGHNDSVLSVSFSGDGKILASGSWDKTIKLWDVQTGQLIRTLSGHNDGVSSVSFSPIPPSPVTKGGAGGILASGSRDTSIKLWDVQTGQLIRTLSGHNDGVSSVSFSPDGKILASGSGDKTIKLWDVQTGQLIRTLSGHNDVVWSVSFSPDGKILASGSGDKTIKLWDVQTGQQIRTLSRHNDSVWSVSFSPDGKILASGSGDKTIKLWDVQTGQQIRTLSRHNDSVLSVSFSGDGKILASGSRDKTIKLWDVQTGQQIRTLSRHNDSVLSVSFSGDGKILASGSRDTSIKLWDVQTGQLIRTLSGHNEYVRSVSFSPDGKILASGSRDTSIKLWDVQTGQQIRTLSGHNDVVWSVSFSPDGKILASGSRDTSIKLWDGEYGWGLDALMAKSCDRVRAYLHNPNSDVREEDKGLCDGIGGKK